MADTDGIPGTMSDAVIAPSNLFGLASTTTVPPADSWAHRSVGMRCATCMWFVEKEGSTAGLGRCRRHAPTMNGYPAVFTHDWCGDHKLDETKA